MTPVELTGLRADVPLAAMAAFGCLRVCQRSARFRGSKLSWAPGNGSFVPRLHVPAPGGPEELISALAADVRQAKGRVELTWRGKLKGLTPEDLRSASAPLLEEASSDDREAADWFAAFGSELATDREGNVDATPFDMTGGQQMFLAGALEMAARLSAARARMAKTPEAYYREALLGPWENADDWHSLGWDSGAVKLGAFTHKAPTEMKKASVLAAVWLAFESLPLFPCFYSGGGLGTRAFSRRRRALVFSWPVWRAPLGVDAVALLLGSCDSDGDLAARGVAAVYRSPRFNLNKYYAAFRAPELAFGSAAEG